MIDACYLYCLAVKLLIMNGDPRDVYQEVKRQAKTMNSMQKFDGEDKPLSIWFDEIENDLIPFGNEKQSNLKYAFVHAFYHFYKQTPYKQAIEQTLKIKGDTNINSMMVGGLLGASQGTSVIDPELVRNILSCKPTDAQ